MGKSSHVGHYELHSWHHCHLWVSSTALPGPREASPNRQVRERRPTWTPGLRVKLDPGQREERPGPQPPHLQIQFVAPRQRYRELWSTLLLLRLEHIDLGSPQWLTQLLGLAGGPHSAKPALPGPRSTFRVHVLDQGFCKTTLVSTYDGYLLTNVLTC